MTVKGVNFRMISAPNSIIFGSVCVRGSRMTSQKNIFATTLTDKLCGNKLTEDEDRTKPVVVRTGRAEKRRSIAWGGGGEG